jgi:serine/threonine-protein kinase
LENIPENKLFCNDCGSETGADADFCPFCGIPQKKSQESPESLESPESPESGSEPPASAGGVGLSEPPATEGGVTASPDDDDEGLEPTAIYSSAELEKLATGEITEGSGAAEASEVEAAGEAVKGPKKSKKSKGPKKPKQAAKEVSALSEAPAEEVPVEETLAEEIPAEAASAEIDGESTMEDVPAEVPPAPEWLAAEEVASPESGESEESEESGESEESRDGGEVKAGAEDERAFTNQIDEADDTAGRKKSKQLQTLTEGTLLNNRYEIVRKIGGGGMGAVYLASDRNLGGVLRAVKEMVQSYIEAEQQEKALADFKRESLLLTSLEHPCIPTIYDYFYDESAGRFYLVMKYISGGDLAARLRSAPEGRVDEKSVTEWAAQTADVLDYLHSRRPPIVYRDLKPSNLMIDGNTGRIMLVDFGIARWVVKNEKDVTAVGTMGYAPPELFSGNVEPRSDIYSLGATMFHLLTGADPQSNPLLIFDFSKNPRPRQVNPNVSNEMEQILMRAVEYNVELRYGSAADLRESLIQHLERVRYGQVTFGQPQTGAPVPAGAISGQNLVFCGFCGEKIIATDVFCPFCGAKQAVAEQLHQQQQQQRQAVSFVQPQHRVLARVTVLGTGELNPPTYSLEKQSNVVGRRDPQTNIFPEVDLSKYDPQTKISRRHARIWIEGETFMIEDLGSSNGTVVVSSMNEALRLAPHQPQVLAHGSKLVVGDTTLHFVVG